MEATGVTFEEHPHYLNESFDRDLAQSQLRLLIDDIQAATKQQARLNEESDKLAQTLKDLEFNLEELKVEREQLSAPVDRRSHSDLSQFFAYLARLEEREVETRARLDGHKQLTTDLSHQRNKLAQRNKKLKAERDALAAKLDDEQQLLTDSQEALGEVDQSVMKANDENEFLVTRCGELKAELEERSEALRNGEMARADELASLEKQLKQELADLRKEVDAAHKDYKIEVRKRQKAIDAARAECDKNVSVSAWKAERETLKAKLKRLRTALATEQRQSEVAQKRDRELAQRLEEMTGSQDGDSARSRAVVCAEIAQRKKLNDDEEGRSELLAEEKYRTELEAQMRLVEQTFAEFERARQDQIGSLTAELDGSASRGYLETLYDELKRLQTKASSV